MRYQVPQFIEVESKIFGPLTLKQFIYLLGAGGIAFIIYSLLGFFFAFLLGLPVIALGAALAFYKVNNQPFIKVVDNFIKHYMSPRLFLWKKVPPKAAAEPQIKKMEEGQQESIMPRFTKSRLKDLAWSLDIKDINK